jgi:hypothetical protein
MGSGAYILLRIALWWIGIAAAAFPPLFSIGFVDLNPWVVARVANAHHLFRDLFYLIVIAAVLAISNLLNFVASKYKESHTFLCALSVFGLLFFMIALAIGLVGFTDVPTDGTVASPALGKWTWAIVLTLFVSLVVEIGMAAIDQSDQQQRQGYRRWP